MENVDPNIARVQHVAKASSDQLLRKFAEVDSTTDNKISAKELSLAKRKKSRVKKLENGDRKISGNSLGERKSLLAPAACRKPTAALLRRLGMSKAQIRARELRNKSIITLLEKTWRRTIEGASKVLMEKHYNRHKLLINDSC